MAKRNSKKLSKRNTHNRKVMKIIKISTIVCLLFLIIEVIYISYNLIYNSKKSFYFDGVNAVVGTGKTYVTVGSNNDNDNHFEKAKISLYNSKKEKTFEKLYNIGYNSSFFGVLVDYEDNIVAVGSYEKTVEDHDKLIRKALIVKYDIYGNILFEKDFEKLDNSKFTGVIMYDENYYVIGQTIYSNTKIGNKSGGALINKYDKNGELIWSKTFGNSKSAIFNDLIIHNNYIYAVGSDADYGLLCKYDLDGNLISTNSGEGKYYFDFSGVVELDDVLYLCGSNRIDSTNTDAVIVQYDLECNYMNKVLYEGKDNDRYSRIIKDDNNNIVAIGIMSTYRKHKHNTVDDYDYDGIIGKYKFNLEEVAIVTYGDESDDYFNDVIIDDNNYLVVGYSSYEDGSYLSKFINYSSALKVLEVE